MPRQGWRPLFFLVLCGLVFGMFQPASVEGARLKDIVNIEGVRDNMLTGFSLVVGLNDSGDSKKGVNPEKVAERLEQMGVPQDLAGESKNVAAVMVTATLPPFARQGSRLDVTISSVGDAKSLQGGILLMTPLKGPDGKVYAAAQGAVSTGSVAAAGAAQSAAKNHPTVGRIANGAIVEREIPFELNRENRLQLALTNPDFTTASRIVNAINSRLGQSIAHARDSGTVMVTVPPEFRGSVVTFLARMENFPVEADMAARVVVNERTGTIVVGENVRISTVALAHGNLTIKITESSDVSQPEPLSLGQTVVTPKTDVEMKEEKDRSLMEMPSGVTLGELVAGLNRLGVTPRDLITILQTIKASGALQAELEIL
ncbi:flagellar basal body P-ring protein FlgI [Magnetococcales bacterium HHB-1]